MKVSGLNIRPGRFEFCSLIGQSAPMRQLFDLLKTAAPTSMAVMITGETGTGKELIARAIHDLSPRKDKSFLKVDCTALPETLLESELFGYRKGAFTDARFNKPGKLEMADGGTVFLDEIGEIPVAVQAKLLRVIEEQAFEPLGGLETTKVNVRIIAATNRDLAAAVSGGTFRADLFYRLNVFPIKAPSLREHNADIPLLALHFLIRLNNYYARRVNGFSNEVLECFQDYSWPGNVRQLKHTVEYAYMRAKSAMIELPDLPDEIRPEKIGRKEIPVKVKRDKKKLSDLDRDLIINALVRNRLKIGPTARDLKVSRTTLWRKMKRYDLRRKYKGKNPGA